MNSTLARQVNSLNAQLGEHLPKIMKFVIQKGECSIAQLALELQVEMSQFSPALRTLKKGGLIKWDQSAKGQVEETVVSLIAESNCVIGVDLGGTKVYGALVDLAGNILHEREIYNHGKVREACYDMVVGLVRSLLAESEALKLRIRGIGIEVPGRVHLETGQVLNAPAVQWKEFPLKERLVSDFKLPVFADNDLKQSALGEAWFGAGKGVRNVALIAIGTGIAAGLVVDGVIQRGAHLQHGEIGWMVPGREFLGKRYEGFGPLEVEASGSGVARRARSFLAGKRTENELANLTSEDVFKAARAGEEWAQQVVSETVDYLAIMVANMMAFYDPDLIILSGGISRSGDLLIGPILKLVEGCVLTQPQITVSSLGYRAGVLGAIANLILHCPDFYS